MPETRIVFYQDESGKAPVLGWLEELEQKDLKGMLNCLERIQQLAAYGYELRRPLADSLRDGIHELRAKHRNVQYRILYFFHGQNVAIVAHTIVKKGSEVPDKDIDRAIERQQRFIADPETHTYAEEPASDQN
jgi:phage-related protein